VEFSELYEKVGRGLHFEVTANKELACHDCSGMRLTCNKCAIDVFMPLEMDVNGWGKIELRGWLSCWMMLLSGGTTMIANQKPESQKASSRAVAKKATFHIN